MGRAPPNTSILSMNVGAFVTKLARWIVASIFSVCAVEANAAGLGSSLTVMLCVVGCDRTTFVTSMLHNVNIFNTEKVDPRVEQRTTGPSGKAFAPIGLIHTTANVPTIDDETGERTLKPGQGTSFLVSPCYILANYHAVFGDSTAPNRDFRSNFYATNGTGTSYKRISAAPEVWGPFNSDPRRQNDWVLLKLDDCEGAKIGWMEIGLRATLDLLNSDVEAAGHPGDKDVLKLWKDPRCSFRDFNLPGYKNAFGHTCATYSGSSGMPIYDLKKGYPEVLAMHASALLSTNEIIEYYSAESANIAIDIRHIHSKIQTIIEADRKSFGARNPALLP